MEDDAPIGRPHCRRDHSSQQRPARRKLLIVRRLRE